MIPTALGSAWRTALLKEQPGQLVYALYANNDLVAPVRASVHQPVICTRPGRAQLPLNAWSHLAMTWDGTTQRLYVNGAQVASRAVGGTLVNSAGALRFGGNGVWSEWFAGRLDEIRVYDRALTQTELQADMATSVTCNGSPPPPSVSRAGRLEDQPVVHGHPGRREPGRADLRRDQHGRGTASASRTPSRRRGSR